MKYLVHIRHADEEYATYLGPFSKYSAARRKADAINRALPSESDHTAWAYVQDLNRANAPAKAVARQAMGLA